MPPSGVQTSLMLAAAAGEGPLGAACLGRGWLRWGPQMWADMAVTPPVDSSLLLPLLVLKFCGFAPHPPPTGLTPCPLLHTHPASAASAGLSPLAMGAGGMLGPAGAMGGPGMPLGHMMAPPGAGMMGGVGMPMAGAASQGLIHGAGPQSHLHDPRSMAIMGVGAGAAMAAAGSLEAVGLGQGGPGAGAAHMLQMDHLGGGSGITGYNASAGYNTSTAGMGMGGHYSMAGMGAMGAMAAMHHPAYGAASAGGMFGFGHTQA